MRAIPITPSHALQSVAGRFSLPANWQLRQHPQSLPIPKPESALYGVVDDSADAEIKLRRVEAVLFLAREPLNSRKISQLAGLADGTEARTLVKKLNQWYDQVGRAFRAEEIAGGYQLLTRRKFSNWVRRLGYVPPEIRLSAPALETLAVVAYRQPVLRADVDAIRGVNSGEILRLLLERDLVRITGRSEELGRPLLYGTTRKFLEVFGLMNLEDLPRSVELRQNGGELISPSPPLPNLSLTSYTTDTEAQHMSKETDVSVTSAELLWEEEQRASGLLNPVKSDPRLEDDDDFEDDEDLDEDEDDDLDDDEDDDLDDEDEDEDDLDEDEDDLDDVDEDFDDEWEEVDDEDDLEDDLDEDEDDEEDDDWDDDEDDDWDDDEEEEEDDEE